jgi:hypothetical protein
MLAPAIKAQDVADVKRLTILTFSAPVQLPGMTLPAGKYRFEMADINNAAHTVRVLSEDGQKVIGTFPTTPTTMPTRDLSNTDTLVMFAERPAGQPQAAKEWYYPQRSTGEEFIYPKAQAVAIAAANHTSVASEDNGKVVRVEGNDSSAAQPTAAAETPASAATTAAATTDADTNAHATEHKAETEVAENRPPLRPSNPPRLRNRTQRLSRRRLQLRREPSALPARAPLRLRRQHPLRPPPLLRHRPVPGGCRERQVSSASSSC